MKHWLFLALCVFAVACQPAAVYTNISNPGTQEIKADGCTQDSDCVLHDADYGWQCCWAGRCDSLDYSSGSWIAVNSQWLAEGKAKYCPSDCGPGPMCPTRIVNINYTAKCVNSICVKSAIE